MVACQVRRAGLGPCEQAATAAGAHLSATGHALRPELTRHGGDTVAAHESRSLKVGNTSPP